MPCICECSSVTKQMNDGRLSAQRTTGLKCRWAGPGPVAIPCKQCDSQVQNLTQALTSCRSRRVHSPGCYACWSATAASCARCAARQAGSPAHTAPAGSAALSPLHSPCKPRRGEDLCMRHLSQREVLRLRGLLEVVRALSPQSNAKCEYHA